jgi:cupin 2 domain-containing protein
MPPPVRNLFEPISGVAGELATPMLDGAGFRLEHIASNGAASAPGFWYDQPAPEWVAVVRGHATLEFADGQLALQPGDSLLIPAHLKHRVASTSADAVWLALHLRDIMSVEVGPTPALAPHSPEIKT